GFEVASYDRERPLIIDPIVIYASYIGGSSNEGSGFGFGGGGNNSVIEQATPFSIGPSAFAAGSDGSVYMTGSTTSGNFPTIGAIQPNLGGGVGDVDAFITKLDPGGAMVYSTYLGGSLGDNGNGIAVDAAGSAYVTGYTLSSDFPKASPIQANIGGG